MKDGQSSNVLGEFVKDYGSIEKVQDPMEAIYDSQIKNISTLIANQLSQFEAGTIIDIGSGKGILLQRLSSLEIFVSKSEWDYVAIDEKNNNDELLFLATKLRIHRRVSDYTIDEMYGDDFLRRFENKKRPYLFFCRNVFHELSIYETSKLLHIVTSLSNKDESFIIQDLQVFPAAERGNSCWNPEILRDLLNSIGYSATYVEEPTKKGNKWFTIISKRAEKDRPSNQQLIDLTTNSRLQHYNLLNSSQELFPGDSIARPKEIALLDYDLQKAALHKQLIEREVPGIYPLSEKDEKRVLDSSVKKQLKTFNGNTISFSLKTLSKLDGFRDRAYYQDALQEFLLSEDQISVLHGGPFIGKSAIVAEVLNKRAHSRQVIFIDIISSTTIWNVLEIYLGSVGIKISYEIMKHFSTLKYNDIQSHLIDIYQAASPKIIVVFDHWERLLDLNKFLFDDEINQFLIDITTSPLSKAIITSQSTINFKTFPASIRIKTINPAVGRFPKGMHVQNVLDDYIDRAAIGIESYPDELIESIDRIPYLAVLAGKIINTEGIKSLHDKKLLTSIKKKLRSELLNRIITETAIPSIEFSSLLRYPIPRSMLIELSGSASVLEAERLGLLYESFDTDRTDLIAAIGALKITDDDDIDDQAASTANDLRHKLIASSYEKLFKTDTDPRWIRECYYHKLASGDASCIKDFGVAYRGELFWAGEYWFYKRHDNNAALEAFEASWKLGLQNHVTELRIAACRMRVGQIDEGKRIYTSLIERFPQARGIKTSYIDSYLALSRYSDALDLLKLFEFDFSTSDWVIHQYGRIYFGLHKYNEAISAFETELKQVSRASTYLDLASCYRRLGRHTDVERTLIQGLKNYPKHFRLNISYAAHLITQGDDQQRYLAENMLTKLLLRSPGNGRVLQQLCKLYRIQKKPQQARDCFEKHKREIYPQQYLTPIHADVLMAEERWDEAIAAIGTVSDIDEHLTGLKKKAYYELAIHSNPIKCEDIAREGFYLPVHPTLLSNVAILVVQIRLASIANLTQERDQLLDKIKEVNSNVANLISNELFNNGEILENINEDLI